MIYLLQALLGLVWVGAVLGTLVSFILLSMKYVLEVILILEHVSTYTDAFVLFGFLVALWSVVRLLYGIIKFEVYAYEKANE